MNFSKIDICNMALAHIGDSSIQSFDDNNRRARLCKTFFDMAVLSVLSEIDWTFARRFVQLQEVSDPVNAETSDLVAGLYSYALPSDCLVPRDLYPEGSRDYWKVTGRYLQCKKSYDEGVYLYYTTSEVTEAQYSHVFCLVVALSIATMIAPALTQDKKFATLLMDMYSRAKIDAWHSDTNIGNVYRGYDGDPENDTFVDVG